VTTERGSGGFWQVESVEELQLFRGDRRKAVEGPFANICRMALNAFQKIEGGARAGAVAFRLQAHAHHAVEDEGQEADHGVGTDAIRQAVMDRRDLDVGFQHAEATLDVRETLVARDGVGGGEVRGVGDQR